MNAASKKTPLVPAKPYERTNAEQQAVEAWRTRLKDKAPVPSIKVTEDKTGAQVLGLDHPDIATGSVLLQEAVGSTSVAFVSVLLDQLANAVTRGPKTDELALNYALAVVTGIEPRDQIEAMLAAQMAATHMQVMAFARRLAHVENLRQQDAAECAYNKLCRTFAAQVEALKRYRSAGEQTVRVEHVTVNEGGQAIVGHVSAGGRGSRQKSEATP